MGRSDTPPGRLALAPSAQPIRGPGERPAGRGAVREPPAPPPSSYGRRRLLVLAIVVTIIAIGYLAVTSLGGGGGGSGGSDDPYVNANQKIAAEGQAMVQAGTDLRTLRDIGKFRSSVEASVAAINTRIAALNRLAADRTGKARSIVRDTITSGGQLTQLGTTFERDVTKGDLGAANRDEAAIHAQLVALQQQADAWNKL